MRTPNEAFSKQMYAKKRRTDNEKNGTTKAKHDPLAMLRSNLRTPLSQKKVNNAIEYNMTIIYQHLVSNKAPRHPRHPRHPQIAVTVLTLRRLARN